MARVLAISSQVARGAIGLSASVPALQTLGHEVIALPTILLSNHPGHAHFAGERVAPELLRRMLQALAENGWLASIDAVLTGYLPSAEHVAMASEAIDAVRDANERVIYLCDPILGDEPKGLYIAEAAANAIRDMLVPKADVLKMNRFECGWLARAVVTDTDGATMASRDMGWRAAVVTSLRGAQAGTLANAVIETGTDAGEIAATLRPDAPKGTGDLMSGLLLGHLLRDPAGLPAACRQAVAGVDLVIARSAGADELQLAACLKELRS